nr:hypothetical protein RKHAN_00243 [Rhizobium sp. Khangiran2]
MTPANQKSEDHPSARPSPSDSELLDVLLRNAQKPTANNNQPDEGADQLPGANDVPQSRNVGWTQVFLSAIITELMWFLIPDEQDDFYKEN